MSKLISKIAKLSTSERIEMIKSIVTTIADDYSREKEYILTKSQLKEVKKRSYSLIEDDFECISWDSVKSKLIRYYQATNYNLNLHPLAEEELWSILDNYNKKESSREEFALKYQELSNTLEQTPLIFPEIDKKQRKIVLHEFEYVIAYEVIEKQVNVLAIFSTQEECEHFEMRILEKILSIDYSCYWDNG